MPPICAIFALAALGSDLLAQPLESTPVWTAESDQAQSYLGCSVSTAGDVNGDGYADVIVGARSFDNGELNEGRVYVYHGSASGPSLTPSWISEPNLAATDYGNWVANAGDVNNDGYDDVIVGAIYYDAHVADLGAAYVYMGSSSGLASTPAWMAVGTETDSYFGKTVAGAGDVNNDGYADVVVSAHGLDVIGPNQNSGRIYVYHGSATGLAVEPSWMCSGGSNDGLGLSVASAGDVNTDGFDDLVALDWHGINLFFGSAVGMPAGPSQFIDMYVGGHGGEECVSGAGDVNGDDYDDVIFGQPRYEDDAAIDDIGKAYVFTGSPTGLSTSAVWTAVGAAGGEKFGLQVAPAGDVNGDCFDDVIVGGPNQNPGKAYAFLGSPNGPSLVADWISTGDATNRYFGGSVYSAGDVNADGVDDVIVGKVNWANPDAYEGRAYVYLGVGTNDCHPFVEGRVFHDTPEDCVPNALVLAGQRILFRSVDRQVEEMVTTDGSGRFLRHFPPGLYEVQVLVNDQWTVTCASKPSPIDLSEDIAGVDFWLQSPQGIQDLAIQLGAPIPPRPGRDVTLIATCRNKGSDNQEATVELDIPFGTTFQSASDGGTLEGSTVTWTIPSIAPDEVRHLSAAVRVEVQTGIGARLCAFGRIGPSAGDAHPADNEDMECWTVVGSWDPNDKAVSPDDVIPPDQRLQYRIRFQNVGTASAIDIVVRDTLSMNVDLATLDLTGASHPHEVVVNGREIVWTFAGVELPDSTTDEQGSHGFVEFEIVPRADLLAGTVIPNRAGIYFDFNAVVLTNTVENVILDPSGIEETGVAASPGSMSIQPNPARDQVEVRLAVPSPAQLTVDILTVDGRRVWRSSHDRVEGGAHSFLWDGRWDGGERAASGVYFLRARIAQENGGASETWGRVVLLDP